MAFKNLYGTDVKFFEVALLEGHSSEIDQPWYLIAEEIGRLIVGGYELGLNPLTHLREIFPSFTWEFHRVDARSETWLSKIDEIIAQSDYIWPAAYSTEEHFVTARRKDSSNKPWRLVGDTNTPCQPLARKEVVVSTHPGLSDSSD